MINKNIHFPTRYVTAAHLINFIYFQCFPTRRNRASDKPK